MLVYMLSKPDNWTFSQERLGDRFCKGRDAMRSIMRNLQECGYVRREISRDEKGHIRTITIVSEAAVQSAREVGQPEVAGPSVGEPVTLVKTETPVKTEEVKNLTDSQSSAVPPSQPAEPKSKAGRTFRKWEEEIKAKGEELIPADDSIFEYADDAGLPTDFLRLAWIEFRDRYREEDKRYTNWRMTFRKSVRECWFKLWYLDAGKYTLTSKGAQAMAVMNARKAAQ